MNKVLESAKYVVEKSQYIKINKDHIIKFSKKIHEKKVKLKVNFDWPFSFSDLDKEKILNYLFFVDSINFCYWKEDKEKWGIKYKGNFYHGAIALSGAFRKAIDENPLFLEAEHMAEIRKKDLENILMGNIRILLFEERLSILKENGRILEEKYDGKFSNLIESGNKDALKILDLITKNFPSYYDSAFYNNREVVFHKRAQLAIADSHKEFSERNYGKLDNVNKLTAFADYKIPQVLRELEILEYSDKLAEKVDTKIIIQAGSKEEVEIRANTIWAVELIKNELNKKIPNVNAIDLDYYLWIQGRKMNLKKPHHRTRTIFY